MVDRRDDSHGCDHSSAEDLFLHAREQLPDGRREAMENHLAVCGSCGERASTLRWMREQAQAWGESLFANHLASEEIVQYVDSERSLSRHRREDIGRHLALCQQCAADVRLVEEIGLSLQPEPEGWFSRFASWLRGLSAPVRPTPVWAYALVLLLAFPAYLGVRSWLATPDSRISTGVSLPAPFLLEPATERGTGGPQVLEHLSTRPVVLEFHVPVLEEAGVRYDAVLLDADGRTHWSGFDLQSIDRFGTFLLLLETASLSSGPYRLVVTEYGAEGPSASTFEFAFELGLQ